MIELWNAYWPVILVGLLIGMIVGYLVFRPRQRVTLSSDTARCARTWPRRRRDPSRPTPRGATGHRRRSRRARRATSPAQMLGIECPAAQLPGAGGAPDNLQALKGVGPKLAAMLNAHGLTRFDQIARLSPGQVEALDADLGAFRGRLTRDRIVEQAQYLARGDLDGYKTRLRRALRLQAQAAERGLGALALGGGGG